MAGSGKVVLSFLLNTLLAFFSIAGVAHGSGFESGYFIGRTSDSRAITFSLDFRKTNVVAILHLQGASAFCRMDGVPTNRAPLLLNLMFGPSPEDGIEGALIGTPSSRPEVFHGTLLKTNGQQAFAVTATNVAKLQSVTQHRGFKVGNRGGGAGYEMHLPEFPKSNRLGAAVTAKLAHEANQYSHEFVSDGWENAWEGLKGNHSFRYSFESLSETQISFASAQLISLFTQSYEFTGGAHGNTGLQGRNFILDGTEVREFTLSELFRRGTDWESALSAACVTQLRAREASGVTDNPTKTFSRKDLSTFTLDESGLAIHFAPYEVGSYAEGSFHIFVPWSEVRQLLDSNGPARFIPGALDPPSK